MRHKLAYGDMMTEERPDQDNIDNAVYGKYIGAEVIMDVSGEGPRRGKFRHRAEDLDGTKVGVYHQNPLIDTREYKLKYNYGTHDNYFANVIAKNLYSQVDSEGNQFLILEDISNNKSDETAIAVADEFIRIWCGKNNPKNTTRGWELITQMK